MERLQGRGESNRGLFQQLRTFNDDLRGQEEKQSLCPPLIGSPYSGVTFISPVGRA